MHPWRLLRQRWGKRKTTGKKFTAAASKKTQRKDLEVCYMEDGVRKMYVNFSDDNNNSDYECSDDLYTINK